MWATILRKSLKATFLFFLFLISTYVSQSQPDVSYQPFIGASEGLSSPIELVSAPGDATGRFFIVEKGGKVKIWNGSNLLATPFIDISALVSNNYEQGLLSMAFHPQYQSNGFFFVYYTNNDGDITVARYRVSADPNVAEPAANPTTPLVSIPTKEGIHNGGHLQFRPMGGTNYLYFATGEGGSHDDPDNNAQDPNSYLGKMIRINVDATPYNPEIWAWGLRNPFRWSFDRSTGDIWIGDVGNDSKEEINFRALGTSGANYGWICVEGTKKYESVPEAADCDTVKKVDLLPILDYDNPSQGRSVIGGYVYRGSEFPALRGYYLATDYFSGTLWLIRKDGTRWNVSDKKGLPDRIASISEAANGALYAVSFANNLVYKIVDPIVTPLNLISFSGVSMNGFNELKWITASEENMDKYIVEYSTDGINYLTAGEVLSGNIVSRNIYTFRHIQSNTTTIYYRLQMSELNGTHKYSPVIRIGADAKTELRIYPTSVTNNLVNIISGQPVERIIVTSINGVQLLSKEMNGATGYFNLALPALQKGIYIIRVSGKDFHRTEKIIVQ